MKKFTEFYDAFNYLRYHPMTSLDRTSTYNNHFYDCIDIAVVKVNPETLTIEDDNSLNTKTQVWLEFGEYSKVDFGNEKVEMASHDCDLDCGADTFEEAIINLANLVYKKYK